MLDESWYGYNVIGIRYLLLGSLGENTEETPVGVYVWGMPESQKQEDLLAAEKLLSEGDYELCVVNDQQLTANWNETYFDAPLNFQIKQQLCVMVLCMFKIQIMMMRILQLLRS